MEAKKQIVPINPEIPKGSRCSQYCSLWDAEDKDCDFYGWQHPPIRQCILYKDLKLGEVVTPLTHRLQCG